MKIDGRTLDHPTLEQIRLMAIRRVREGEDPGAVISSYGFNRTTIYKWMRIAAGSGNGLRALSSTRGTGRPRSLTAAQERQVFRWVNGRDPRQYGLDFGLWTRAIVALLIERKFGIDLGVTCVGSLLTKLQLTPPKPLQRAYQRDPEVIGLWQQQTYPALARQAKRDGAQILFWDESGFRADTVHGRTCELRGQTPIVYRPGQRPSISAASAIRPRGEFWFCTYVGGMNGELFVELLRQLMHRRKKLVRLILDSLPAHRTPLVRDYVESTEGKLSLYFLPGYAPELNPDELVWSHVKRTGTTRRSLQQCKKLAGPIDQQLADVRDKSCPLIFPSSFRRLYS
jgi:transposase